MSRTQRLRFPTRAVGESREKGLLRSPARLPRLTRQFDSSPRPPRVPRPSLRVLGAERNLTAPATNQEKGRESESIAASEGGRPKASSRPRESERTKSPALPCVSASVRSPRRGEEDRTLAGLETAAAAEEAGA